MRNAFVDYPRIAACSLLALVTCACARWSQADSPPSRPQGRVGVGPLVGDAGPSEEENQEARIIVLQKEIDAMEADLVHLRFALDRIGGTAKSEDALTSEPMSNSVASANSGDLYAPPPRLETGESLFFQAKLSTHASRSAAEAEWRRLTTRMNFAGLSPRFFEADGKAHLLVGPFTSAAAAQALCAEVVSLSGGCQVDGAARANP